MEQKTIILTDEQRIRLLRGKTVVIGDLLLSPSSPANLTEVVRSGGWTPDGQTYYEHAADEDGEPESDGEAYFEAQHDQTYEDIESENY